MVDYSKWDRLQVSSDEDEDMDVHPNVDRKSFLRAMKNQKEQNKMIDLHERHRRKGERDAERNRITREKDGLDAETDAARIAEIDARIEELDYLDERYFAALPIDVESSLEVKYDKTVTSSEVAQTSTATATEDGAAAGGGGGEKKTYTKEQLAKFFSLMPDLSASFEFIMEHHEVLDGDVLEQIFLDAYDYADKEDWKRTRDCVRQALLVRYSLSMGGESSAVHAFFNRLKTPAGREIFDNDLNETYEKIVTSVTRRKEEAESKYAGIPQEMLDALNSDEPGAFQKVLDTYDEDEVNRVLRLCADAGLISIEPLSEEEKAQFDAEQAAKAEAEGGEGGSGADDDGSEGDDDNAGGGSADGSDGGDEASEENVADP